MPEINVSVKHNAILRSRTEGAHRNPRILGILVEVSET